MIALLYYLAQVLVISGILYAWYHFALRNNKFHRYNRFYLMAATVISITIPFLNIPVYFTQTETDSSLVLQTLTIISSTGSDAPVLAVANGSHPIKWLSWQNLTYSFYILIASIALLRIFISLIKIRRIAKNNPVEQLDTIHFVNTNEHGTPFSFFRWLFWNRKIELRSEKGEQIFRHELFHIKQRHSWDIMYMELLTVVCWINPFFHLMKKEVKAIHEFLADQFAITESTKWQYAELLLMQALNTNQCLVNSFFHNQIKRRISMITTSKKPGYHYLRKLMVLPVASIVIALFAFSYKQKNIPEASSGSSVSLVKIQLIDSTKPYPDTIIWIKKFPSPTRKSPSQEQLNVWQDSKMYGIWLDNHKINNNELLKHTPSDFALYFVSKLEKNAINYGKHYYQVTLLTDKYYSKTFPGDSQSYYLKHIARTDTTKPFNIIENKIFNKVETEPSFPGGESKWNQYCKAALNEFIPTQKRAPAGTYTVIVQFIAKTDSFITDVKALTNHGYGMEEEAIRLISKGPRWIPAIQNGHPVNAYKKQPVTFVVGKGQKNFSADDQVFDMVETPPSFPGGDSAWRKYLQKNINALVPVDSGAPVGIYKVIVQFIVSEDGSISDIKCTTNHGFGMEGEAMRLIRLGPKWIPAKQNGHMVKAHVQQPITFELSDDDGANLSATGISFPVENAVLKIPFGKYYIGSLPADNPGITLSAGKGSKVRSMQNGEIAGVYQLGNILAVTIRDGNCFTTYSGLENIKFKKGEKVNKGDILGEVSTNKNYELDFIVMERTKVIDPISWLINQ